MCLMPYANIENRSACASSQSDQRLCCSLPRQNDTSSLYIRCFKILAGLCSWAGQFVSCLVWDSRTHFLMAWLIPFQSNYVWRVKRICVFEHSVMTNFSCTCPAIQRGQGSGFLSNGSSWLSACMSEQRRFWRDCVDAQARLDLRCSHRR